MFLGFAWVELYVHDATYWRDWFERIGFQAIGQYTDGLTQSYALANGGVLFLVSEGLNEQSPVTAFLQEHPQGVAEVGIGVHDWKALKKKVARLLLPARFPETLRIATPAGITLSFTQGLPALPPGFTPIPVNFTPTETYDTSILFETIDHIVLNVTLENFDTVCSWFHRILDLKPERFFEISTTRSALKSFVLNDPPRHIRIPVNAPLSANSQIQEFLDAHRGAGVQHIALRTRNIAHSVEQLSEKGISFLDAPETYYDHLDIKGVDAKQLQKLNILVDQDETGDHLLQIFSKPLFEEPTLFFELIERQGKACGFGEGNFQSLFEAIEREQQLRGTLP
jgi:4-hydroxyphenylpyruvate dioxygenase